MSGNLVQQNMKAFNYWGQISNLSPIIKLSNKEQTLTDMSWRNTVAGS